MSIFSIGISGLHAAQQALYTTSNNISNVYTPGYNREVVQLGESRYGGGVQISAIERQFDRFVNAQLNTSSSALSALETYEFQIGQIDTLLADQDGGLAPLMNQFFASFEALAGGPADPAARQGVLGSARALASQFRAVDEYLDSMQQGINGQIGDEIAQINSRAEQLAGLNREIGLANVKTGSVPNTLLNQREQLVAELGERLGVSVTIQDGGRYNLTMGNGRPLVMGSQFYSLEAVSSSVDPSRTAVGYRDSTGKLLELDDGAIQGGSLGGLLDFRSQTLDATQQQLGQLAVSLAEGVNGQHRQGVDLNGLAGKDFFRVEEPLSQAAGTLRLDIEDIADIAAGEAWGSGDNRNALALQELQSKPLVTGKATLSQAYGALVSEIGNRTQEVQVRLTAQTALTEQLRTRQQSESGVNLDEEAARLVQYQQYYQANAKVIEMGATLFDTLLGLRA
ncbi:flagellar hook-associated protein FlgK [Zobellella maritima]|uniref:flagellar hook-associated protein FlgK n=1 Tax=Zobellella maritima TaxID=2059725 RepID=UPI000E30139E|nr:flagellar hook-associated protein FlgK [Zobellella maritima]